MSHDKPDHEKHETEKHDNKPDKPAPVMYPAWRFHPDGRSKEVTGPVEDAALKKQDAGWTDKPFPPKTPKPATDEPAAADSPAVEEEEEPEAKKKPPTRR